MELETISRASANYNSSQEAAKVSVEKEQPEVTAAVPQKAAEHIVRKTAESGMTGCRAEGARGKRGIHPGCCKQCEPQNGTYPV